MKPGMPLHGPAMELLGIEMAYFIAIVALSLYIYFKSRELFNLTKYKGIDYFSNTFLFFSLAYLLRLWTMFERVSFDIIGIDIVPRLFGLDFLLMGYFSTVAVIYLILSAMHGAIRQKFEPSDSLIHVCAVLFSFIVKLLLYLISAAVFTSFFLRVRRRLS